MNIIKNMLNIVAIVIGILFYHTNMNEIAFHVDSTYSKENTNSLKFNEKKNKFYQSLKVCRTQKLLHMCRCIQSI